MTLNAPTTFITKGFEKYLAQKTVSGQKVDLTHFIFADLPEETLATLDKHSQKPDERHIVHRQVVSQVGVINKNAVAYSCSMGTDVGNFEFNYIGLLTADDDLAMFVKTGRIQKVKNSGGVQGNSLTRNLLLEFSNAAEHTQINVSAETWQIDFTARLLGIDEKIRLSNFDLYGIATFLGDGFKPTKLSQNTIQFSAGSAYVYGYRVTLSNNHTLTLTKPSAIYLDVSHIGTVTSEYQSVYEFTTDKTQNYTDAQGVKHYIVKLCDIDTAWNLTDLRTLERSTVFADELNAPDGFKFVGQAESVAQLRTIEPTADQQRILLKSWHAGKNLGGGEFYADFTDNSTADNGGTVILTVGGKRWKRVLDSEISAFDFGAVGDGVADDAQALNRAAVYCQKQWGKTLFLRGEFNLGSTVSFRHCKIEATRAKFIVGHNGIGLILGGAGNNANNPTQQIDEVIRAVGLSASTRRTPLVQIIGAKGQYIDINRADYVQIYADATAGSQYNNNYSSAYSTFNFKYINTIELFGENGGWINENMFNLNRCHKIVLDGDYLHNHNVFNRGCMEGKGEIYCNGSSNQFVGFRFERRPSVNTDTLQINFTENSWNNHIEASWQSSKGYTNNPYGTHLITVNDEGLGNTINHIAAKNSQDVPLFSLTSQADIAMAGTGTGGVVGLSNMAGVRNLKRLPNGEYEIANNHSVIYESPLIDLTQSPIVWFRSSEPHFRMSVYYFNAQEQRLTNKTEVGEIFSGSLYWNDTEGFSFMQANSQNINFHTKANQARFAKVIISSGSNVAGLTFNAFALGIRQFNQFSKIDGFRLEMLPEPKGGNQPLIYQNQEIDMDKVPEGVVCYKSDLTEMRVNIQKMPLLIKSIVDKTITLAVPKMFLERGKGELLYKSDTDGSYKRVAVTSGYHITITLTENAPTDLSVNSEAYFIITKVKGL